VFSVPLWSPEWIRRSHETLDRMSLWAIVPVKPLGLAKSRLAGVLTSDARRALTLRALTHELSELHAVQEIEQVLVVCSEDAVRDVAVQGGAHVIADTAHDLNGAVQLAIAHAQRAGAVDVLIAPADLPLMLADDVRRLIAAHPAGLAAITICPDRHERGTNALLISPPDLIAPRFGENSLEAHVLAAQAAGAHVQQFHAPTLMLDVDTPQDLAIYEREAAMRARRSVRRYLEQPVRRAALERVLAAAAWAPSAHNRQPWRFSVLTHSDDKQRLAHAMGERLRADRLRDGDDIRVIDGDVARSRARITEAPALIVVSMTLADMDRYPDPRRSEAERIMAIQSVAMAVQNLLLAAHNEGLGACWMCAPLFCADAVRAAVGLPEDHEPQALITLGAPANAGKPASRKALTEVVRWA
jgi:coenzyme F420-0:L-glutamate ligase / coenzyme F420-1:gamma-L-glutamate ligase